MNFQIVNIATPNSVHNTCVFCCFAFGDSVTNLHAALDRFKDQVEHLNGMKWSLELQNLPLLQAELEEAQQAQENFQQMATYVVLVGGAERNPRAVNLLKQTADKKKHVKALETQVRKCRAAVKKGFNEKEGPFVKRLDSALQEIGVQRQQYFGGAFIGNHVHKALKLPNIQKLCTSISEMTLQKLPHRSEEVAEKMAQFITAFSLFGKCHNICDQNFIEEAHVHALDSAVHEFMAFFRGTFADATTTIKMHLLEDHATQWANATHVGFGLLGEQGAELIHAKFNRLGLAFAPIRDRVKQLQCIVKEHLLSIEPQIVAAIPPPTKRIWLTQT
ncbi:hypothetical protein EMCRGX_G022724 [Ephydatia muelleri]